MDSGGTPSRPDAAAVGPLRVRCACGWETSGDEASVVEATIDHGRTVHNMIASRDEVLAMAVADDGPG